MVFFYRTEVFKNGGALRMEAFKNGGPFFGVLSLRTEVLKIKDCI